MENRWSQRTPLELNLVIHYAPLGLIRATTKDVSSTGMFIDTGRIILSPEETIELSFSLPSSRDLHTYTVPASVVHSSAQGSGIEFVNCKLDDFDLFNNLPIRKAASY